MDKKERSDSSYDFTSCKDNNSIGLESNEEEQILRVYHSLKDDIVTYMHSTKYQIIIVSLVVLDSLIVLAELMIDLELRSEYAVVPEVLHSISLCLLIIFMIEIFLKVYALRCDFFAYKAEVFDAIVVIVAFILDASSIYASGAFAGSSLIIVLRLWRVIRIQNSMVISVRRSGEQRLRKEQELRMLCESELERYKAYCNHLESICQSFNDILKQNEIQHSIAWNSNSVSDANSDFNMDGK